MKPEKEKYRGRVAVVTGGLLHVNESSIFKAIKKQFQQFRASKNHWLATKIKLVSAETILLSKLTSKNETVKSYFDANENGMNIPELTAVVLMDELYKLGVDFEVLTYDDLFKDPEKCNQVLDSVEMVFASSTLLHDLSELMPLLGKLKRPHIHLVLGGALTGSLFKHWEGDELVEVMAIGYGEYLVPVLVGWMKSHFEDLPCPEGGKLIKKRSTAFLFAGLPPSNNLDFLPRPDWKVAEKYHGQTFRKINYESVRGCPYRCNFCNYPFLFADTKFRYKSAVRMAEDWKIYQEAGVESIVCLDSLFTMPKRRLEEFCELLIKDKTHIKWTCYARADDLLDGATVAMMKAAGASQVQIGIESGNQELLDAMNKKCTVEHNLTAIEQCNKHGITSLVSLIVGFPGETQKTLDETLAFMDAARPDFHFLATFSVRVEDVPVLNAANRNRFALATMSNHHSFAPYWNHYSMSCTEVGNRVRELGKFLAQKRISLDGAVFYKGIDGYQADMKPALLDYQANMYEHKYLLESGFNQLHGWVDKKLNKEVTAWLKTEKLEYGY